jgi:glycosyltransferase involved in cell wall biosynthesis
VKIAIVHYHFERGGVTRVVENALESLQEKYGSDLQVVLLSGRPVDKSIPWPNQCIDDLDYSRSDSEINPEDLYKKILEAAKTSLGSIPDIWHIHNHSLGKNKGMADLVRLLAKNGNRILLQIHDFAEDGRPANYRLIQKSISSAEILYPYSEAIHYAVLNNRDYVFMQNAGIPHNKLHLLPNPVPSPKSSKTDWSEDLFAPHLQKRKRVLYPVRVVRRKNIGELLLLSILDEQERLFLNTLPPTNDSLLPQYNKWKSFIKEYKLSVELGAAEQFSGTFDQIVASSEGIISTSVAEGFGLGFLEPWMLGKAVTGRDLPEITQDFKDQGVQFEGLYNQIKIPLNWIRKDRFRKEWEEALRKAYQSYAREISTKSIDNAFAEITMNDCIDFSALNETMQEEAMIQLMQIPLDERKHHILDFSPIQFHSELIDKNQNIISQSYSLQKYGEKLSSIYQTLLNSKASSIQFADHEQVLNNFMDPKRFLLLRTD